MALKGGRFDRRCGEPCSQAIWRPRGRGVALATAALALALPLAASAGDGNGKGKAKGQVGVAGAYVAPGVVQAAKKKSADETLRVIIQSTDGSNAAKHAIRGGGRLTREFKRIGMIVAELTPEQIDSLSRVTGLTLTLDAPVKLTEYTSTQLWPHQNGVAKLWGSTLKPAPAAPAIAIVDSGIDKTVPSFGPAGERVKTRAVLTELPQSTLADGRGHGTFVAGLAAGAAAGYAGSSPESPIIDLDVMDDTGMARTSDVIEACEWILQQKDERGIRVANLSLHSIAVLSIRYHPLNRAVEKLWFSGVTVITAAGNYGVASGPSGVRHAPGNDPFVITVGAVDLASTARIADDTVAPWSAYGYTNEGFAKPDVVAAGRYMVGPVPSASSLVAERPEKVVAPGYMQLSGTSFAAPVVAGIAAQILARNPTFTPDQVKGALMRTGRYVRQAPRLAQGRGEVNAVRAANVLRPGNPNAALSRFVVADPSGGTIPVFNASGWYDAMRLDSAWDSSGWADSGWSDAGWAESGWADSAWSSSAWESSAWESSAWESSAWESAAWVDGLTYEDNSAGEPFGPAQLLTPAEQLALASDPALALP